eukprot:s68_g14.t1
MLWRKEKSKILAVGAANSWINWTEVEASSKRRHPWSVVDLNLTEFGPLMLRGGFQMALDQYADDLEAALTVHRPDALLFASKGLNLLTHLVETRRWTGPSVLLNSCDHIAAASQTWEEQWLDSMSILRRHKITPIVIGVGSSSDEQMLILDMMEERRTLAVLGAEGILS